jgi:hypothetical protein
LYTEGRGEGQGGAHCRARICKRLRIPGINSARLGIDCLAHLKVYKYRLW